MAASIGEAGFNRIFGVVFFDSFLAQAKKVIYKSVDTLNEKRNAEQSKGSE